MNNPVKTLGENASALAHDAAQAAEHSVRSVQRATQQGLDRMADELDDARAQASSALKQLTREADSLRHRSMDAVSEGSHQLREKSAHMKDATTTYIQHEPVKSMLMAAAVGAALMGLVALFSRHGDRHR
jgi:ElaB/YqjD/DUF883 family membrane-anchored ribosome-binding protein